MTTLHASCPTGPMDTRWARRCDEMELVAPANRRKYQVIVVGTGLGGASAAATLGELGYAVRCFCYQDSPRRAHSIAAQGGINAAKNYPGDGDTINRLFHDTVKGGDFRARESNVHRLAELSVRIIDHCVAQAVPFARDYGGLLSNRSFGGAQVARTFYARGQTGQQLLLGAYQALQRQIAAGTVAMLPRTDMLELVVVDGRARGIVARDLVSGKLRAYTADAVVLATGGYSNVFYLSTNAKGCNATAIWRAHRRGALFANPCFTQIHPTCIPVTGDYQSKLTLMSESLRNDGRVWVPNSPEDRDEPPNQITAEDRDYFLERRYPAFGNLVPRDIASRAAKAVCDEGRGVGGSGYGVYLDFAEAIARLGRDVVRERYGNLFEMYELITASDPYKTPMRIFPAAHYTMGGLWVDYQLMSNLEGLFVIGEANFADHGANRLGASALMQGLADGYFILPATLAHFFAQHAPGGVASDHPAAKAALGEVRERITRLLGSTGKRSPDSFHRELGQLMWEHCGMTRSEPGLRKALERIPELRAQLATDLRVVGGEAELNQELERALRVTDLFELAELVVRDALHRGESCGGHFREESQTAEGEALRDDQRFAYVAAWEHRAEGVEPALHREPLEFELCKPVARSYK